MNRSSLTIIRCVLLAAIAVSALVPGLAGAVTREAVLTRGERWLAVKVPYSQSRYADAAGNSVANSASGWRTDCSGFVSMSLGLLRSDGSPLSLDTASLPSRLRRIKQAELKPGDIILRPKNLMIDGKQVPYGHAVVFVRWMDTAKTSYIGYHESSSRGGAVAAEIRYPFFGEEGFSPYRYTGIEDTRLRKSRQWLGGLATIGAAGTPFTRTGSMTTSMALGFSLPATWVPAPTP